MGFVLPAIGAIGSLIGGAGLETVVATPINAAFASAAASTVPSWVGMASLGATALGGVSGAYGAISSANAQAGAANYNASIAAQNAELAKKNEEIASQSGMAQEAIQQQKTRAYVGELKTQQAASGVDVNSGSAVDVRSSAAELGELDALTVRSNATREAFSYGQQAESLKAESALDKFEASNASTAGGINAASTILGSAGNAVDNYYKYKLQGGFSF